jgi:NADP-dependent 3-hydroxy acid dehydrogenase YdfG
MQDLNGLRVVITGASSGFGMETSRLLVEEGCKVTLGARREERLEKICSELGRNSTYRVTDVTKRKDVHNLVSHCIDNFGGIDALINNAGIMPLSLLKSGRVDEWDEMIDVNIKGVLYGTNAVFNHFMDQGFGKIINISSTAGKRVMIGSSVYSGTKFAVNAISEGTRLESTGIIQVTCIMPGAFQTELGNSIKDEAIFETLKNTGLADVARPAQEVAQAIKFALQQDQGVAMNEVVIRPTAQDL